MSGSAPAAASPATTFITLGGFLGAGKTSLMSATAELLRNQGLRVVLVTNDQGEQLVDTVTASRAGVPVREVTGGCFCCRFDDLAQVVVELVDTEAPDVVIAEAVGSCTDLTATVLRPLRAFYGHRLAVAPLTVVLDPARLLELGTTQLSAEAVELGWLLHTQLEDADLIVLSKGDQTDRSDMAAVRDSVVADYPETPVAEVSSVTGEGLGSLTRRWLSDASTDGHRLEIDYERYGEAEALMAWGDRRMRLDATPPQPFPPEAWVEGLLRRLAEQLAQRGAVVGHVKVSVSCDGGSIKASLVGAGGVVVDHRYGGLARTADVLLNARVGVEPAVLADLLDDAVSRTSAALGVSTGTLHSAEFSPAQPEPTHRIATAAG